jgi:hypothetical protein
MRSRVIALDQEGEVARKPETDIRKILRESDDRARKVFERRDPIPPDTCREPPEAPSDREEKGE